MLRSDSMYRLDRAEDQHVALWDVSWEDYERLLAIRGHRNRPRMYYLDGVLELVSPSGTHEYRKSTLGRLLEQWATELDVELSAFGEWRLKRKRRKAGAQPDESYVLGPIEGRRIPDLVIEVEWSRRVILAKHEIYLRLGVREMWTLTREMKLVIRVRADDRWVIQQTSQLLPSLDPGWLLSFTKIEPQSRAARALRDELRNKTRK